MRAILVGLAGLAVAACGEGEGSDQKTYGAKPSDETVELTGTSASEGGLSDAAGDTPDNQEITGTPGGMSGGDSGGVAPGSPTQNQSRPVQAQ